MSENQIRFFYIKFNLFIKNITGKKARLIASYLPQYHPILENDEWWGKGFTEWTNVTKAKPLFRGHEQPKLPSDLGFYDLRVLEVRDTQAILAKDYGIEGFAYWHYWFGKGRRLLERSFNEILRSGKPDFPFCLAWANECWTGIWHGLKDNILIEQTDLGINDYENHFYEILPALKDKRYIKINNKPLFIIYQSENLANPIVFINTWKRLAMKERLEGIYFIAIIHTPEWNYKHFSFDNISFHQPEFYINNYVQNKSLDVRVIFLKSWNEWAEGNYLEPDQK